MTTHAQHVDALAKVLDFATESSVARFYERLIATERPDCVPILQKLLGDLEAMRRARRTVRGYWSAYLPQP